MITSRIKIRRQLRVGELVEVRSKEEILGTLDKDGRLQGLPFMPEMFQYCGKQFRVFKRAHKTCDTVFPIRGRRMANAVHLETRCSGEAHGGCQAACLIFWKDAWLKRVNSDLEKEIPSSTPTVNIRTEGPRTGEECREEDVHCSTRAANRGEGEAVYVCQTTRLPYATGDLKWWDIRQYIEDYRSGNVGVMAISKALFHVVLFRLERLSVGGWRIPGLYDKTIARWTGTPWPIRRGLIANDQSTPTKSLNLQSGDLVRVKSYDEILSTLNRRRQNRGMSFDKEMVPFCGGEYRVHKRVTRIIDEKTGKMLEMKTPCIILDQVFCQSRYSECRLFCPRSIFSYWREIWLERVPEPKRAVVQSNGYQAKCAGLPDGDWNSASDVSPERELVLN